MATPPPPFFLKVISPKFFDIFYLWFLSPFEKYKTHFFTKCTEPYLYNTLNQLHVNDHWLDQTCNRKFITPCKKEEERIALISILVENTKCLVWFKTLYQFYDFVCYSQNKTLNYASLTFKLPLRLSAICPFYSFAFIEKPQSYKPEPKILSNASFQ